MEPEKIRSFFVLHFEKIAMTLMIGVSTLMVYQGLQKENILDSHQPDHLIEQVQQVRVDIDKDRTASLVRDRIPKAIPKEIQPLPPAGPIPPITPDVPDLSPRRQDPVLLPPQALQVQGVAAPIALRSNTGKYPLRNLDAAEPLKVEQSLQTQSHNRANGMHQLDADLLEALEMELATDEEEFGLGAGVAQNSKRRLRNPIGFRPKPTRHLFKNSPQPPVPGVGWFIAGTAVMPNKALHQAYRDALAFTNGFDPQRDRPIYQSYQLQRADVTARSVDELVESDWIKRDGRTECIKDAAVLWSGFAPEIVPVEYRADATLTMWIPPVMLTDYSVFALHPLIPMLSPLQLKARQAKRPEAVIPPEDVAGRIIIDDGILGQPRMNNDPEQMAQLDFPPQRQAKEEPVDYKLIRFYDFANDPRDPDAPQAGHRYVYRLRVAVEDPNFPVDPKLQPRGRHLSPSAFERVMSLVSRVKNAKDPARQRWHDARRWTPWSETSDAITLPSLSRVSVGPVAERKLLNIKVGNRVVQQDKVPPTAKMVISRLSEKYGARISMLMKEVAAGTVLNKSQPTVDVVDPITLEVKQAPQATIATNTTVVDIEGGKPLDIHQEPGFVEPSMILMFDAEGGLKVHEETDDLQPYRIESFADERGE